MITSRVNRRIVEATKLRRRDERYKRREFLLTGTKLVREALDNSAEITNVFITEDWMAKNVNSFSWDNYSDDLTVVTDKVMKKLTDQRNFEGIVATVKMFDEKIDLDTNAIYLDDIRDPGNLGTIIRTAEAAGYRQVLLSKGCVDIYNEKVVRGTMGSLFRINFSIVDPSILYSYREHDFEVIAADLHGETLRLHDLSIPKRLVLVFGNESHGLSKNVQKNCTRFVKIPIYGEAESLNVSVAAGIIMYAYKDI